MRTGLAVAVCVFVLLGTADALACGGGFGEELEIDPEQIIVIVHKDDIERYVFMPGFCGQAADFGLVLPLPDKLSEKPSLADEALFDELDALTAPVMEPQCEDESMGCGAAGMTGAAEAKGEGGGFVDVEDRGRVGIFDYAVLKADSPEAFTDWLDANGFPYEDDARAAFEFYVAKGWHFVAFRVNAAKAARAGEDYICGSFGPIRLEFPTQRAVIPTRIAITGPHTDYFEWRVYTVASHRRRPARALLSDENLRFAGRLDKAALSGYPAISALGVAAGDWLTKVDISFDREGFDTGESDDIEMEEDPDGGDFQETYPGYIDCPGCLPVGALGGAARKWAGPLGPLFAVLATLAGWRLARRGAAGRGIGRGR
jgi:hypothetical protein